MNEEAKEPLAHTEAMEAGHSGERHSDDDECAQIPAGGGPLGSHLPWWAKGDTDAFISVASQNLATLLSCVAMLQGFYDANDVSTDVQNRLLYSRIVPAFGMSLAVGNLYY